ncbi:MAG: ATP-binding protein [Actinomycetota bacterium]
MAQALSLPRSQRGAALLEMPEDQWFERKGRRISPQALANQEVGLANADGGIIVIGLAENSVEGTDADPVHRNHLLQAAQDLTEPPVHARGHLVHCINSMGRADHLLVIDVEPGEVLYSNQRDEVFLRVGDENRKLTYRQRQELSYDKGQTVFEAGLVAGVALGDLDHRLLASYAKALGHKDPERLLAARGLTAPRRRVTVAGYLLFGKQPQTHFPEAYVRVLRYGGFGRGTGARQQLLRDVRCEGPILSVIDRAAGAVRSLQPTRRALGERGRFEEKGLIPEPAWLEGLVNAVVHRSYSLGGDHIRLEIFEDRIETESPGRFPGLVDPREPLAAPRFARNPRIARVSAELGYGQELGEGIRRMFEEMRLAGLPDPLYRQTTASVRLTLVATTLDRELEARLPAHSRDLLALLRRAERLSTGEVADSLGVSRPAIIRRLNALKGAGLVEWIGSSPKDPRAYWRISSRSQTRR